MEVEMHALPRHPHRARSAVLALTLGVGVAGLGAASGAAAAPTAVGLAGTGQQPAVVVGASTASATTASATCPPRGWALGFSDALDKQEVQGVEVGGLSALARDVRRHAWAAIEDHSGDQPTRMWFLRDVAGPGDPTVSGTLLLRHADGTPYDGSSFDAEGLAVLPTGQYVVSSEVEPSIHIFGRDGVEVGQLPVPARFRVAPEGQATDNATLEGLSVSRDGSRIYAAMEGTLSGDVSRSGDDTFRRVLVYERGASGYHLAKQVGYQLDPGMRISEVSSYGRDSLLVMEAAWNPTDGNTIRLYAAPYLSAAADVSEVADLGDSPDLVAPKQEVADVTSCPDLGAKAKEAQTNPLMDNYEAMAITHLSGHPELRAGHGPLSEVVLLSDDNFNDAQTTRVLRLAAQLP
ncbi:esterase-like activity of phytase family protein [Segeticoccus rhizosphaerae]|uniref:esterase-like activity of phytase family protein n=1 Tax=Segeticoccus rhizosphaerae TaxID=1104777 RepID=UPI0010BFB300|nr:esterase-like activity of phytase family protein [Ornithinicoccus soli]